MSGETGRERRREKEREEGGMEKTGREKGGKEKREQELALEGNYVNIPEMHKSAKAVRKTSTLEVKCAEVQPIQDDGDGLCVGYKKGQGHSVARGDIVAMVNYNKMALCNDKATLNTMSLDKKQDNDVADSNTIFLELLNCDSDSFGLDTKLSGDTLDEEKSQRSCLIDKRKHSAIFDDIEKPCRRVKDDFRELKIILAVLIALILGGGLFMSLHYCFRFTLAIAGGLSGAVTLVMCVASCVWVDARCVVVLISVAGFTNKGRAALLCIITGVLLSGPGINIASNVNEVATTLACMTEIAFNQSLTLQRSLEQPLQDVQSQLQHMAISIKQEAEVLKAELDVIKDGVVDVEEGVERAKGALQGATAACENTLKGIYQQCEDLLGNTNKKCRENMARLDPTKAVKSILDKIKSGGWFTRRKRSSPFPEEEVISGVNRQKRGIEDVCNIFDGGDVCSGITESDYCKPVSFADAYINNALAGIVNQVNRVQQFFNFQLVDAEVLGRKTNLSAEGPNILKATREVLQRKTDVFVLVIDIIIKLLSTYFLAMIFQAYMYRRNYLSSVRFDNIYITTQMKDLDKARANRKQESILPLRRKEKKELLSSEISGSRSSDFLFFFMHIGVTLVVLFFNYVFYFILYLIGSQRQDMTTDMTKLDLYVAGTGPVVSIMETFVERLNSDTIYSSVTDVNKCLPKNIQPDYNAVFMILSLYTLTFALALLQSYGLRLRSRIAAFYFPEQEASRSQYLYNLLEAKRRSRPESSCSRSSSRSSNSISKHHQIIPKPSSLECMAKEFHCQESTSSLAMGFDICLLCEDRVVNSWSCGEDECGAVVCLDCFREIGEQCPLCTMKEYEQVVK